MLSKATSQLSFLPLPVFARLLVFLASAAVVATLSFLLPSKAVLFVPPDADCHPFSRQRPVFRAYPFLRRFGMGRAGGLTRPLSFPDGHLPVVLSFFVHPQVFGVLRFFFAQSAP